MQTEITTELLHQNGWQSWLNDDEMYFTFNELTLLYNPDKNLWGFASYKYNFQLWGEVLMAYHSVKGVEFIPGSPILPQNTFLKNPLDYPVEIDGNDYLT